MPKGYDETANEAWERAKAMAESQGRPLSLADLWWGVWAVMDDELCQSLPEAVRQQLTALRAQKTEQRVKVSEKVTALDAAIRQKLRQERRSEATIWDILQALLDSGDEEVRGLMEAWGLEESQVRGLVERQLKDQKLPPVPPQVLNAISPFVINLTELAAQGQLSPAYERDEEREAILLTLLSKTKRNVALVGPAGVGKTKLVEDLALRIHRGEIPALKDCIVLALDLVALRAGTDVRGELEQRMEELRKVLEKYGDRIILFIDELHTIVGTPVSGRTLDIANALKPLLASGKIRCIGATTRQEYVQHIESDRALARRFQVVTVQEPSKETMRRILEQVKDEYERYHDVQYLPETLDAILDLSERFLPMRHFPDKAIELLDMAGALVKLHQPEQTTRIVRPEDVKAVLAKRWQLPIDELEQASTDVAHRLLQMVVGQEQALKELEQAVKVALAVPKETNRPRAVWLFVGPSGVGKTWVAQQLAFCLCRNERAFLELDLRHFVRRYHLDASDLDALIGVRPPYVGWERGGILTNHVMEFPRSLILVRGLEEASPEVHRLFEEIFERGICQDGRGQEVSFHETFFVIACDLDWQKERRIGFAVYEEEEKEAWREATILKRRLGEQGFPTELLRYIQAIIPFAPLTKEDLKEIAKRWLASLSAELLRQESKSLEWDEELLDWVVTGDEMSPEMVLERLERMVLTALAELKAHPQWDEWKVIRLTVVEGDMQGKAITPRLLVVDDAPDFFEELRQTYTDYEWHYADTVEEAERLIHQVQPHLVLVDTCQSASDPQDIRGLEILKQLKSRFPQVPVIMVTAQAVGFETTREAFKAGAYDYLWKPPEESVLRQIVTALVRQEEQQRLLAHYRSILWQFATLPSEIQREGQVVKVRYRGGEKETTKGSVEG